MHAGKGDRLPYNVGLSLDYGPIKGPESVRDNLELQLMNELQAARCFGDVDRFDPERSAEFDLRLVVTVTSGLGGEFPAGYPVAVVTRVIRNPQEPFAEVSARPIAALNQIRELMLIWNETADPESEAHNDE